MATGEEIRRSRTALKLSQAALARAVGVKPPTIGKIERGLSRRSRHKRDVERYLGLPDSEQTQNVESVEPTAAAIFARLQAVENKVDDILNLLRKKF